MNGSAAAVLLDIEGTTTPVDFVYRVLFPYAHARVTDFLAEHGREPEVAQDVAGLREEHARDVTAGRCPPDWSDSPSVVAVYARSLMDQDRKATALKSLQGKLWADGYRSGELKGQVYADVPRALARWTKAGKAVAIFSSGSVLAQKLIFGHTEFGDLTPYLSAYFDTTTGPKGQAESYRRIAAALHCEPGAILFVSDVVAELEAAREAELETALAVRSDTQATSQGHRPITTFDALP